MLSCPAISSTAASLPVRLIFVYNLLFPSTYLNLNPSIRPLFRQLLRRSKTIVEKMTHRLSPLSPTNTNRIHATSIERNHLSTSPAKHGIRIQDRENIPFDPQLPSSPFAEDAPPIKTVQSPSRSPVRSPKKKAEDYSGRPLTEDALRENEGLTRTMHNAIDPSLGRRSPQKVHIQEDDARSTAEGTVQGFAGMDDTCFSAFSAVPNVDMTRFANLGRSPEKLSSRSPKKNYSGDDISHYPANQSTPSRHRSQYDDDANASPTPRRHHSDRDNRGDTTNLILDFTDQFNVPTNSSRSPTRQGNSSPRKFPTQPDLSTYNSSRRTPSPNKYPLPASTPSEARQLANLLDFDLPPAPTPRSIPSISARELESMKSQFLSQVSSLTATLSGKEAEVRALKDAVTDAERRAGEAQEQIRDERSAKEGLAAEKADWEKRQGEMQAVLRDVKEEITRGDREKDDLLQRVHEAEHKREEAESQIAELESQVEGLRASAATSNTPVGRSNDGTTSNTNSEVEAAVTKVAKELHGLYKSKHETKVTALKKSYSDRWEKKIRDLNTKVDELSKENEDLRIGRDATMSTIIPINQLPHNSASPNSENLSKLNEEHRIALEAQQNTFDTKLSALRTELSEIQTTLASRTIENTTLKSDLELSRIEIASLIEASEELMLLSTSTMSGNTSSLSRPASAEPPHPQLQHSQSEIIQKSFSRSTSGSGSGLQRPGFAGSGSGSGESRIGRMGGPGMYSGSGRDRRGSGLGRSGGILSNIERMGRGREA